MPSVMDMKKNNMAQMFEPGNVATASGYTWNTNPGPVRIKFIETLRTDLRERRRVFYSIAFGVLLELLLFLLLSYSK